jgi:hypothetical protein
MRYSPRLHKVQFGKLTARCSARCFKFLSPVLMSTISLVLERLFSKILCLERSRFDTARRTSAAERVHGLIFFENAFNSNHQLVTLVLEFSTVVCKVLYGVGAIECGIVSVRP